MCYIYYSSKALTNPMKQTFSLALICTVLIICGLPLAARSADSTKDVLLDTMQRELHRATTSLAKSDPAPYYLSYSLADIEGTYIVAANGGIVVSVPIQRRQADVMMRVGTDALDNTHSQSRPSGLFSGSVPLNDDADAIARVLWQLTDREYEQASAAFLKVKTNKAVHSAEEDQSPDFSQDPPQTHLDESRPHVTFDQKAMGSPHPQAVRRIPEISRRL